MMTDTWRLQAGKWIPLSDYSKCRELWLAGLCPCCSIEISEDDVVIAEGVRLCELCEMRGHHLDREHVTRILKALLPARA